MTIENTATEELSPSQAVGQQAELPPAEPVEEPAERTFESVVDDALGGTKNPEDTEEGKKADETAEGEAKLDPEAKKEGEEEDSDPSEEKKLSFQDHPNWKKMVDRKNELETEVETLREKAERTDHLDNFLQSNRVTQEEAMDALGVVAAINSGNLVGAYQKLEPIFRQLEQQVGVVLPPELQQQVDQGYMTEDYAKQLAVTQASNRNLQNMLDQRQKDEQAAKEREQQQTEQERLNSFIQSADQLSTDWISEKKSSDPDYGRKEPFLQAELSAWAQRHGPPKTTEEVTKALNESYDAVTQRLSQLLPPKPEVTPHERRPSRQTNARPDSFEEAFEAGLNS